jgi:hypothetical protein
MGLVAVCAIFLSIALMISIGLLGPSSSVPDIGGGTPPWSLGAAPSDILLVELGWSAIILGGLGVLAGLYALRRGWRPPPRALLGGSALAVVALVAVPPAGSTDVLNYAIYGRIAAIGGDPYVLTAGWLRGTGDPVGALAPAAWRHAPSVYGPLATWVQRESSFLAGDSMAHTVFILRLVTAAAFLLAALALDRLAGPEIERRVRAQLLWGLNPLMLWQVVMGGHVDGLAAVFVVLALLAVRRMGVLAGLGAGALLGAAAAVKLPFILAGAGLVWAARRSVGTLLAVAAGIAAVLVPAYLAVGSTALADLIKKVGGRSVDDPWRLLIMPGDPDSAPDSRIMLATAALLVVLLLWRLPPGPADLPAVRPALACCLGWLITSPVQHPWYDAMLFPLLGLMSAGWLDALLVVRAIVAGLDYLPGVADADGPAWLHQWLYKVYVPWMAPAVLDAIIFVIVALCLLWARPRPGRIAAI